MCFRRTMLANDLHHQPSTTHISRAIYSLAKLHRRRSTTGSLRLGLCSSNKLYRQPASGTGKATFVVAYAQWSTGIKRRSTTSVIASSHHSEVVRLVLLATPFAFIPRPTDVKSWLPAFSMAFSLLSRRWM